MRAPERFAAEPFDLVVVGGGVYGIAIAAEATRRGLRPVLLERADFGSRTSHQSLRVIHGGLRYLKSLDLARFRESVKAQSWFFRSLPGLVEPLPCLMPLYDEGVHRRSLFRIALAANSLLARAFGGPFLPSGRVLGPDETRRIFPGVDARGLRGAALWYDGSVPNAPRLFIELLRRSCGQGAAALNYVETEGLLVAGGRVAGVRARDVEAGAVLEFRAPVVINAAGPWSREFSARCASERPELFAPSIAWNLLFAREAPSDHALAARARAPGSRTYFLVPWKGALLAGTGHAPWTGELEEPTPTPEVLASFIDGLNRSVPSLKLSESEIVRVFAGLIPAARPGTADLATREVIVDHGATGGPGGLFSVSGVKLTVAARVAEKVLGRAFPNVHSPSSNQDAEPIVIRAEDGNLPLSWMPKTGEESWKESLRRAIAEEAVVHLDDLLMRRSSLGDHPARAAHLGPEVCGLFDWDAERTHAELARLSRVLPGTVPSSSASSPGRLPRGRTSWRDADHPM